MTVLHPPDFAFVSGWDVLLLERDSDPNLVWTRMLSVHCPPLLMRAVLVSPKTLTFPKLDHKTEGLGSFQSCQSEIYVGHGAAQRLRLPKASRMIFLPGLQALEFQELVDRVDLWPDHFRFPIQELLGRCWVDLGWAGSNGEWSVWRAWR
jgi:hypothetical protein